MNVEEFGKYRKNLQLIDVREPDELEYHRCFKGAINVLGMSKVNGWYCMVIAVVRQSQLILLC